jgi:microcystin-dependent protein
VRPRLDLALEFNVAEPFLGQILTVPYNFAPLDWAFCTGQLLPVSQNAALFSLLGATYGGNGSQTFGVPSMAGRVVVSAQGSQFALGEAQGAASVTLTNAQLPIHNHPAVFASTTPPATVNLNVSGTLNSPVTVSGALQATAGSGQDNDPQAGWTLAAATGTTKLYAPTSAGAAVPLAVISSTGSVSGNFTAPASGTVSIPVSGNVSVGNAGSSLPVPTMPPYIALNNVIALSGLFPSRQ